MKPQPDVIELRVHQSELTYEAALSPPIAAIMDAPGSVASRLLPFFGSHKLELSDIVIDDGPLVDRGLGFELPKLDASVSLRPDRFEIRFTSIDVTADQLGEIVRGIWQTLAFSVSPNTKSTTAHSLLFEVDCDPSESYSAILERFCPPVQGLPPGAVPGVVYYLPEDRTQGFLDSNFMLNRSSEVEEGLLVAATLVFEAGIGVDTTGPIQAARARFDELLHTFRIKLVN